MGSLAAVSLPFLLTSGSRGLGSSAAFLYRGAKSCTSFSESLVPSSANPLSRALRPPAEQVHRSNLIASKQADGSGWEEVTAPAGAVTSERKKRAKWL